MILKLKDSLRKEINILKLCPILASLKRRLYKMIKRICLRKLNKLIVGLVRLIETPIKFYNSQEDCD